MSDKLPSNQIKVTIGQNPYEIKFPTNGQLIDIERMKIQLTNGTHKDMLFGSGNSQQAYFLVEAIATFTILLPNLNKDLTVSNLLELNPYQSKSILEAYEKTYFPWMQEWNKVLNPSEPEKKEEDGK